MKSPFSIPLRGFGANILIGFAYILITVIVGYYTPRTDFFQLISLYGLLFGLHLWAYQNTNNSQMLRFFVGVAIVARVVLLFAMPSLSDDIFRFIWDGKLWHSGINPFDALPSFYLENGFPNGVNSELYQQLNSPNYFTIYPPVAQLTFYVATFWDDFWWNSVVMKLFLLAAEFGSIWLLFQLFLKKDTSVSENQKENINPKTILLYALNPLILIEIMGNLHFEGVMIFFLLLAYYWLKKGWANLSAVAFALSVASKLLPLMFLPFLIYKLGWKRSFQYFIIVGSVTIALFYPLLGTFFIENFGNSLNLYFQKFEFNASLYYALRWLGFQITGYNLINLLGPLLALTVVVNIMVKALKNRSEDLNILPLQWLFAICLYLFCTTTVHPWYTALLIVLSLFTKYRFPILWSGLIFLTYINYSYLEYFENLWMVAIEYILVIGYFLFEWKLTIDD